MNLKNCSMCILNVYNVYCNKQSCIDKIKRKRNQIKPMETIKINTQKKKSTEASKTGLNRSQTRSCKVHYWGRPTSLAGEILAPAGEMYSHCGRYKTASLTSLPLVGWPISIIRFRWCESPRGYMIFLFIIYFIFSISGGFISK